MNETKNTLQRRYTFTIGLLVFLLTALSCFSLYQIHTLNNRQMRTMYQAEAIYQRSLGDLANGVQTIHNQLAQLLILSDKEQLLYNLAGLWREVYAAIQSFSTLPVAMYELEQTDLLLHDIAEYSYYLMKKNVLTQKSLSQADWHRLEDFYHRTDIVQQELKQLETTMLNENFYLTSIALDDEENPVRTAFLNIESKIGALPSIEFEDGVRKLEPEPRPIQGTHISEQEAIRKAETFLQEIYALDPNSISNSWQSQGTIAFTLDHTDIPVYGVMFPDNHYIEVSQIGGHILQYYHTAAYDYPTSLQTNPSGDVETAAYRILQTLQFPSMACVEQKIDDTTANFVFVPIQDNVYLYPDMVKVQLSLEDGTLLSFDQTSYQTRHYKRTLSTPALTQADIQKDRNPNFQIDSIQLALIMDLYSNQELLCYELRGNLAEEQFSIFVEAHTGQELRIVHL